MKMNGKLVLGAIFGILSLTANAQERGCKKLEQKAQWMKDSLALTAEQFLKINEIHATACKQMMAVKEKHQGSRDSIKVYMKDVSKTVRAEYKKVLTTVQLEKMKQSFSTRKDSASKGNKRNQHAKMNADKLKAELKLTDDQTAKVEKLNLDVMEKRADLKAKKQMGMDSTELKKQLKALRDEHKAGMKAILTDDQYVKWMEMRKSKAHRHQGKREK